MTAPSARGLFKATGNVAAVELAREKHDFYPTPPEPVWALLKAESGHLARYPVIWEPAVGDGAMAREISAAGHQVIASDLVDRGWPGTTVRSFYDFTQARSPAVITNPPYLECNSRDGRGRWLWHALDVLGLEYMALLLSWSWPGAAGLGGLWQRYPPARVYLMRWKIDFTGQGAPPMLNGWFVWDRQASWPTQLLMMDRHDDPAQGEMWGRT